MACSEMCSHWDEEEETEHEEQETHDEQEEQL